ncbi:MAG: coproporphyrinogen III oxidase [Candidatus Binatia bacterium]|nr:MAG: coproporphyrinogen III oxidase [Candidatus Binatia bacterium]
MALAIYVHVPYCPAKCPYCDFNVRVVRRIPEEEYVSALLREIRSVRHEFFDFPPEVVSVFFGGGTPSLFHPRSFGRLLDTIAREFRTGPGIEVSLETNPDGVDLGRLRDFRRAGIGRLSIGAQSFDEATLRALGRWHSPAENVRAFGLARAAGFENVNLDLIFGVPGQSLASWSEDLATASGLRPEHVSTYGLTYEPRTAFGRRRAKGELVPLGEEEERRLYDLARERLLHAGYVAYELSNFALPGRQCLHNRHVWGGGSYLGFGAGAHSYVRRAWGVRWENVRPPAAYERAVRERGHARARTSVLRREQAMIERILLGLRRETGIDRTRFAREFGWPLELAFPRIRTLVASGHLAPTPNGYRLAERAKAVADSVLETLVA